MTSEAEFRSALDRIPIPAAATEDDIPKWRFFGTILEVIERLLPELRAAWIVGWHPFSWPDTSWAASRNASGQPIIFTFYDFRPAGIGIKIGPDSELNG